MTQKRKAVFEAIKWSPVDFFDAVDVCDATISNSNSVAGNKNGDITMRVTGKCDRQKITGKRWKTDKEK